MAHYERQIEALKCFITNVDMTTAANNSNHAKTRAPWRRALQRFFDRPQVELSIGGLIVTSVALVVLELSLAPSPFQHALGIVNYLITCLFAVELTLRFLAAANKRRYLREFWVDLIAITPLILPLFPALKFTRVVRLLRLLRVLRLLGMFSRYASLFPYIFRRGAIEYIIVSGLVMLTVVLATGALLNLESDNEELDSFGEAMWFSVYTLLAGEPTPMDASKSLASQFVVVGVMFMGMTVFAMFTGTVSAFMVDRLSREGRIVKWEELSGHTIICGWNREAEIIVREHLIAKGDDAVAVVIAELRGTEPDFVDPALRRKVQFLDDDFTKVAALEKAGIRRAERCIVLADLSQGRSEQDADARTILTALTVERLNPDVYTCAELLNREYGQHLEFGNVNDYVVSGEYNGYLLAQASLNRGLMRMLNELLTFEKGNQFYRLPLPGEWKGKTFFDLFTHLKRDHQAILVAVDAGESGFHVNPRDYTFVGGEDVVLICDEAVEL